MGGGWQRRVAAPLWPDQGRHKTNDTSVLDRSGSKGWGLALSPVRPVVYHGSRFERTFLLLNLRSWCRRAGVGVIQDAGPFRSYLVAVRLTKIPI